MHSVDPVPRRPARYLGLLKLVLTAALLSAVIGFGYTVIPWYYYHYHARNQIAAVMRNGAVETDEELKRKMAQVARAAGIKSEPRDFRIARADGTIGVTMHYTESCKVSLFGKTVSLFSLGFDISVVSDLG
jgi:hypothetical protein